MPAHLGSVGAVTAMFSEYGRISLVRVLLEGKPVPCDLRNYATQVPDMGTTLCAVVEFESEEEATNCVKQLNSRQTENGKAFDFLGVCWGKGMFFWCRKPDLIINSLYVIGF